MRAKGTGIWYPSCSASTNGVIRFKNPSKLQPLLLPGNTKVNLRLAVSANYSNSAPSGNSGFAHVNFSASCGSSSAAGDAQVNASGTTSSSGLFSGRPNGGSVSTSLTFSITPSGTTMVEQSFTIGCGASGIELNGLAANVAVINATMSGLNNSDGTPLEPLLPSLEIEIVPALTPETPIPRDPDRGYADPVDSATGAYTIHRAFFPQNCPTELSFMLNYDSLDTTAGPMGKGWSHNFMSWIDELSETQILLNWDYNRRNYFTRVGSTNTYVSTSRSVNHDVLTRNSDGSYTLLRADQSKLEFNGAGLLVTVSNKHGQNITLSYGSEVHPTSIKDSISNRAYSLTYNASKQLTKITDPLGRQLDLAYSGSGYLSSWSVSDSANVIAARNDFTHDASGRILTATDAEGVTFVQNTYDSTGRVILQDDALPATPLTEFNYSTGGVAGQTVTSIKDRNGFNLSFRYDQSGQLLSFTNQNSETTSHTYDAAFNCLSTTDARGNTTSRGYDANGNVISTTDPSGATTQMFYDSRNNLTKISNAANRDTLFAYDTKNNLVSFTNALNQTTGFTFDSNSILTQRTAPRGGVTVFTNTGGLPTSVKDANNLTTNLGYDAAGRLTSTTDPLSKTYQFAYDTNDNLVSVTDPLNHSRTFTHDSRKRRLTASDALGATITSGYNGNGDLLSSTDALGNVTGFSYDAESRLIGITDPRGGKTILQRDPTGRFIATIDPTGVIHTFRSDGNGNPTSDSDSQGFRTRRTFNSRNLLTSIEDPRSRVTSLVYDNLRRLTSTTNPLGESVSFTHDDLDRLVAVNDPLNQVTNQGFDADGNLSSITNARSATTSFAYDLGERMTSQTIPGNRVTAFGYNSRNLTSSITEPSNQQTTLNYDDARRLTSTTDPQGTIAYSYDNADRLVTTTEGAATISRFYDAAGRLTQFTDAAGNVLKYAYDASGNLGKLTYPDNKEVNYLYDSANRMVRVTDWAGRITSYSYDSNGRLHTTTRPNGTVETRTWHGTGELASLTATLGASVISQLTFSYDLAGRIAVQNPVPSPAVYAPTGFTASYDLANQVASFSSIACAFDADGNMTTGPNLTGTASSSFVFDSRNRLTSFNGVSYTYDSENRRTSWTDGTGTTAFVINPNARLSQVLVRTAPSGIVTRAVYGLGLLYDETDTSMRYYHFDYRGSAVAFTSSAGGVIGRVEYGPYGETATQTGDTATPFLFCARHGVMTDPNGLYQMRARYYHPTLRRFINQDVLLGDITTGVGLNRFAYANGNPVSLIDPFGLAAEDADENWFDDVFEWLPESDYVDWKRARKPDYVEFSSGVGVIELGITVDRNGNVYLTGGIGFGIDAAVTENWIDGDGPVTDRELRETIEGVGNTVAAGYGGLVQSSNSDNGRSAHGSGVGLGIGYSSTYTRRIWQSRYLSY
ncbi:MAG: hypothetical protein K1X78_18920 [Verrucomicrobiaceae bacterium]|nr:hypothetical protein [Verrucomicrobiaceae bacterium]